MRRMVAHHHAGERRLVKLERRRLDGYLSPAMNRIRAACLGALLLGCNGSQSLLGNGTTGQPCAANSDCASSFCLPFADGYCSSDCSATACNDGETCLKLAAGSFCLQRCTAPSDCRDGYMCFQQACQPACMSDHDCSRGFGCTAGQCQQLPGKPQGAACASDAECSSRDCEPATKTCQIPCGREDACPAAQTCFVNPVDSTGGNTTDSVRPICIPRRSGKAAVGTRCSADGDCAQGACELGICTVLCQSGGDCAAPLACYAMAAQVDYGNPQIHACLPKQGNLDVDLGMDLSTGALAVPTHAISFSLEVIARGENAQYITGVDNFTDPAGTVIYKTPATTADFYATPIRFEPAEGSSTIEVSNSPLVKLVPLGLYTFNAFAQDMTGKTSDFTVHARIKLHDGGDLASGHMRLHVFITNLSGGCLRNPFTAANASASLSSFESKVRAIFGQASITLDEITYADSTAASTIMVSSDGSPSPELSGLLKAATAGDTPDALELVIVRSITTSGSTGNNEVLGIAGGIPGNSGIPGTLHSGAVTSISSLCYSGQDDLALTAAHELAHSLGLFHSVEQDGHTDQFTDDDADGVNNLMYWEEAGALTGHLSAGQCAALRENPVVTP
jgi:hypothetical protein